MMWFLLEEWDVVPCSGSQLAMWCEDILPGGLRGSSSDIPAAYTHHPITLSLLSGFTASIWLLLTERSFPQLQKDQPVQGHMFWMWPRQMGLIGACRHPIKSSSTHLQEGRMTCSLELARGDSWGGEGKGFLYLRSVGLLGGWIIPHLGIV